MTAVLDRLRQNAVAAERYIGSPDRPVAARPSDGTRMTGRPGRRAGVAMAALLACVAASGCGEAPRPDATPAERAAPMPETTATVRGPTAATSSLPVDGCLKGGTTRAEVQALLGAPDSISWGVWLYGRSEITFGYGVVVAFSDVDGNLQLC